MMDVDGSNLQYVCDGREPAWSPDGQKIAFSKLGGNKYIHVVNADGSNDRSLGIGTAPDWSPDGQLIVFVRDDGLWVMDANGQGARPITSTGDNWGSWRDNNPAWSPDGLWIAFDSSRNPDHVISPTVHELWLMRASGGTPFRLTDDPGHKNRMPAWSPDGQTIVFSRDSDIYTIDVDGSNMTSLTNNTNVEVEKYPTWSPDGLWIAFELVSDTGRDVCKMDTVGLFKTCLTNSLWGWNPDWKN
jgi:Tol biopolymer transport system component